MTWFKNKKKCQTCKVLEVNIVHDKRLCNTLVCHQAHLLITYCYGHDVCSNTVLYDESFYARFKASKQSHILADDKTIWHL
ncbi:hypothetical protein [Pseudoalteromonas luteoviolacea]|uniref:Uncharacterized protein n=1 Tax=Pseudoalteromonas luteoviolacea DSM 6061 TaxID=1365250 RepID=A0A166XVQ0_9GAMM|nr:hypothetical protein [Pseudoalteromonas luteoviolacea]KZN40958.1 hypothetical protein N475_00860 [Pseudoalteromonas luteoviolacea DSM 6061]